MITLPPGTILQHLYFKERLRKLRPGRFIEIGVGEGHLSHLLLDKGWQGVGYEIDPTALSIAQQQNASELRLGRYRLINANWLDVERPALEKVDLIVSSFVLEHLDDKEELRYFEQCKHAINIDGGMAILFVPGSPKHWGIEDEMTGHYRRYSFETLHTLAARTGWTVTHMAGLTYPLSNLLMPLSDLLIKKQEAHKEKLTLAERTRQSGSRNVRMKTHFPNGLSMLLNEYSLYPWHLLQKIFTSNERAMIIYLECQPDR